MAEQARVAESDLWQRARIVAGAQVADVGCGPGALLPALSDAVAPTRWDSRRSMPIPLQSPPRVPWLPPQELVQCHQYNKVRGDWDGGCQ